MNRQDWDEALLEAVSYAIENMAFMEVEPGEVQPRLSDTMWASLACKTPVSGQFRLTVSLSLARAIGAGIYGMAEEKLNSQELNDLLAEMLNTLAGNFLSHILPPEQLFTLALPQTGQEKRFTPDQTGRHYHFLANEHPLFVSIYGDILQMIEQDAEKR